MIQATSAPVSPNSKYPNLSGEALYPVANEPIYIYIWSKRTSLLFYFIKDPLTNFFLNRQQLGSIYQNLHKVINAIVITLFLSVCPSTGRADNSFPKHLEGQLPHSIESIFLRGRTELVWARVDQGTITFIRSVEDTSCKRGQCLTLAYYEKDNGIDPQFILFTTESIGSFSRSYYPNDYSTVENCSISLAAYCLDKGDLR